jgi:hypothetical protein
MATKPWEDTAAGQAAMFGWSQSVINSDPELKKLFALATKENWTTDHFVAKVRDTKWFKTHSDSARQAIILFKADPATYKQNVAQTLASLTSLANQMGAVIPAASLQKMATEAYAFGWNSDQLRQHLVGYIGVDKEGRYSSGAATVQENLSTLAAQYGVDVSPRLMSQWVKGAADGSLNADEVKVWLTQQASSRYPALADRLKAGETLMDIASPYMQSYAQTLELNPNAISLKDNMIQSALSAKDAQGKPTTKSVWEFENDLRNDPRYMKTQQAQDKSMAVGHQVLRDFGFMGS